MKYKTPYADLVPPLSTEEFEVLKADIRQNDVQVPILVDEDGNILDGHHRYKCKPSTDNVFEVSGMSERQKIAFVFRQSNNRRNLSPDQKNEVRRKMQKLAVEWNQRPADDEGKWTQKRIASEFGVDRTTVTKWFDMNNVNDHKAHIDHRVKLSEENKQEVRDRRQAGDTQAQIAADLGIDQSRVSQLETRDAKRAEQEAKIEEIAKQEAGDFDELYDVIVIDPPWEVRKIERDLYPNQTRSLDYPTMTLDEIADLKMPAKANCHLWLWTTQRYLPDCFDILNTWNFYYVATFVWHKSGGFQPTGLPQYNCEFALYGRRGSPKFKTTKAFDLCFTGKRRKHSQKPSEFYDVVRRVTGGKRIDIFNREKIDGFVGWGNECKT